MNRTTNAALLLSMLPALNYPVRLHDLCFDLILQLRSYFKSHESSGAADLSLWRSPPSVCVCVCVCGGVLSFFPHTYSRALHLPFTPKNIRNYKHPIFFEILATPKNIPHLRKDPKMHRNDPKI